jgi:hypothetical protein
MCRAESFWYNATLAEWKKVGIELCRKGVSPEDGMEEELVLYGMAREEAESVCNTKRGIVVVSAREEEKDQ